MERERTPAEENFKAMFGHYPQRVELPEPTPDPGLDAWVARMFRRPGEPPPLRVIDGGRDFFCDEFVEHSDPTKNQRCDWCGAVVPRENDYEGLHDECVEPYESWIVEQERTMDERLSAAPDFDPGTPDN